MWKNLIILIALALLVTHYISKLRQDLGSLWTYMVAMALATFATLNISKILNKKLPVWVEGYSTYGWGTVGKTFRSLVEKQLEPGGAISIYHKGKLVVEYVGGYADVEAREPWNKNTLQQMYSASQCPAAVVIAMLVDRNLLSYEEKVVKYWPEFGQNGKDKATVGQLLSHQVGVVSPGVSWELEDTDNNYEGIGKKLAAAKSLWEPDIDGYFGLPLEENYRCARQRRIPFLSWQFLKTKEAWRWFFWAKTPKSITGLAFENFKEMQVEGIMNRVSYRKLKSCHGHFFTTATAGAKLMGIIANGGCHNGKQLLSPSVISQLKKPLASGHDLVLNIETSWGPGPLLRKTPMGNLAIGLPGYGGQMMFADPKYQLGWTYTTNYLKHGMGNDERYVALERAIYESYMNIQDTK